MEERLAQVEALISQGVSSDLVKETAKRTDNLERKVNKTNEVCKQLKKRQQEIEEVVRGDATSKSKPTSIRTSQSLRKGI